MDNLDWLEFSPRKDGTLPPKPGGAPTDAAGFALEARRLRRAGHFHAAAMHYAQSVGLQEHQFSVWAALIDCLIRAGRTQEADAKSREVLDAFRKVRELYASRALALVYAGQLEAARPLLDVALEGNRPHWYASVVRGEFILRETPKRVRTAVDAFEQAIALAEDGWEPCFLGGWVLLRAGCAAPAAGFFAEAVHQDPKAAASLIGLGDAFRALRLYDQAAFYCGALCDEGHDPVVESPRRSSPPGGAAGSRWPRRSRNWAAHHRRTDRGVEGASRRHRLREGAGIRAPDAPRCDGAHPRLRRGRAQGASPSSTWAPRAASWATTRT
jgi:hypothetical protein